MGECRGIDEGDDGEGEAHRRPIPKAPGLRLFMVNITRAMAGSWATLTIVSLVRPLVFIQLIEFFFELIDLFII